MLVQNEFFFMNLARACGIPTAKVQIIEDRDKNTGLLVERFDRQYLSKEKKITKIHQEDACQFLNHYPADKYRVSYRNIADGLTQWATTPVLAVAALIQQMAFSYLIHNGDLHAKNISLFQDRKTNQIHLTPAYDLLSTLPYGDKSTALHLDGKMDNWRRLDFLVFGESFGVNTKVTNRILNGLGKTVEKNLGYLSQIGLTEKKSKFLQVSIQKRLADLN